MKANELMIGDWVKTPKGLFRVTGIQDNDVIGTDYNNGEGADSLFFSDEIEPIPLTPEIFEKNGFKKVQIHGEKQDDIFQCFDGEIIIEVGIYDPDFILIHYRYETPDGINSGELSSIVKVDGGNFYLHELQHALRLCGIEKEIVL